MPSISGHHRIGVGRPRELDEVRIQRIRHPAKKLAPIIETCHVEIVDFYMKADQLSG